MQALWVVVVLLLQLWRWVLQLWRWVLQLWMLLPRVCSKASLQPITCNHCNRSVY